MPKSLSPRGLTAISSNFGGGSLKFMPKPLSPRGLTGGWVGGVPKNPKIPLSTHRVSHLVHDLPPPTERYRCGLPDSHADGWVGIPADCPGGNAGTYHTGALFT